MGALAMHAVSMRPNSYWPVLDKPINSTTHPRQHPMPRPFSVVEGHRHPSQIRREVNSSIQ
jgi:hypothetical protein